MLPSPAQVFELEYFRANIFLSSKSRPCGYIHSLRSKHISEFKKQTLWLHTLIAVETSPATRAPKLRHFLRGRPRRSRRLQPKLVHPISLEVDTLMHRLEYRETLTQAQKQSSLKDRGREMFGELHDGSFHACDLVLPLFFCIVVRTSGSIMQPAVRRSRVQSHPWGMF